MSAQEPDGPFEVLSTAQGLSYYVINAVVQDSSGFLWVGTQNGLNRYDGHRFATYTPENSDLSDRFIVSLFVDRHGMLWIGTLDEGLYTFNPDTEQFTQYAPVAEDPDNLSHKTVQVIYEDSHGALWIGTRGGGLNRFDRETGRFRHYRHDPSKANTIASDSVWTIHQAPNEPEVLWIGTQQGLNRLDLGTQRITWHPHRADGASLDAVRALYADQSGMLWVGTSASGLYAFDRSARRVTKHFAFHPDDADSLSGQFVRTIHEDLHGGLWIGTANGGLNRFDRVAQRFSRFVNEPGVPGSLPHNNVYSVLMDQADVLWAGTWGGLAKYALRKDRFQHFKHDPEDAQSLSNDRVLCFLEDQRGDLWVGTSGGGLNKLDSATGRFERFTLAINEICSLSEDRSGGLWLGTNDLALYHFDGTAAVTRYALGSGSDYVLSIYEAPSEPDMLWVTTMHSGLYKFDASAREVVRHYQKPADSDDLNTLSANFVWPILEDRSGVLWIGTWSAGLNRFDRETETFTRYQHDDKDPTSLSSDRVISLHEDNKGTLWIGTMGGGLNAFDRETRQFRAYTVQEGLAHNNVDGILSDETGRLWVSTNNGLSLFNPDTEVFVNYGVDDGLQSAIFHIGVAYKNARGQLFFGGENGFNVIDPKTNLQAPPLVLTDVQVLGQSVALDSSVTVVNEIKLPHNQNSITLEFAALDFTDPSKNQYAYKIEERDADWISLGNEHRVHYPILSPGTYTFRVKGSNNHGVWNEEGASLRVVITPPWWQQLWFVSLGVLVLASMVFGAYRVRIRRVEARALNLERLVEQRTHDLRTEKEKTEEQAERLQELEKVKDRFFTNISHEFRTPLTLILGPVEDALGGAYGTLDPTLRRQLEVMQRNGHHLQSLINQLLDLSKLEVGHMRLQKQPGDLIAFLKEIVLAFSALADRQHITLQFHPEQAAFPLEFDDEKLEQVVTNLLSNAFKFTPKHGKIRVSVRALDAAAGSFAEIRVKDTGQGIPADELSLIFDRFHQVDSSMTREHEGTGIGLALAKELVELHGGELGVESEQGFGSTFIIRLPLGKVDLGLDDLIEAPPRISSDDAPRKPLPVDPMLVQAEGDLQGTAPMRGALVEQSEDGSGEGSPVIVIVDDNADVRAYLKSHLAAYYRIVEAADGVEGLEKAYAERPDLVISDVMMPKVDGYDLCRTLKTDPDLSHIPVILLTAKASEQDKVEGLGTGADDYIYKPFNAEVLLARVENLIEIRRLLRQRFSREVVLQPSRVSVTSVDADFLEQVNQIIETYLENSNFGVDWLATEVGVSPRQLQRKMKKLTDLSPGGYIKMMRMERSAQLLEQRAGTVAEVAYRVGFNDPGYFAKEFRKLFGVSPSEYPDKSDKTA